MGGGDRASPTQRIDAAFKSSTRRGLSYTGNSIVSQPKEARTWWSTRSYRFSRKLTKEGKDGEIAMYQLSNLDYPAPRK